MGLVLLEFFIFHRLELDFVDLMEKFIILDPEILAAQSEKDVMHTVHTDTPGQQWVRSTSRCLNHSHHICWPFSCDVFCYLHYANTGSEHISSHACLVHPFWPSTFSAPLPDCSTCHASFFNLVISTVNIKNGQSGRGF